METVPRITRSRAKSNSTPLVSLETAAKTKALSDSTRKALNDVTNGFDTTEPRHGEVKPLPVKEAVAVDPGQISTPPSSVSKAVSGPKALFPAKGTAEDDARSASEERSPSEETRQSGSGAQANERSGPTVESMHVTDQVPPQSPPAVAEGTVCILGKPNKGPALPEVEMGEQADDDMTKRWLLGHGSDVDSPGAISPPWKLSAQVHTSQVTRPCSSVIVASPDKFDPRSIRQLKKEVKAAMHLRRGSAALPQAGSGIDDANCNKAALAGQEDVPEACFELCNAMGSLEISASAASQPEPLRGMPSYKGRHTRFDDSNALTIVNSPQRPILRGVPAAQGSHKRFDE